MPAVRNCPSTSSTWVLPRVCSTSSISTFCAASMVKARWWCTIAVVRRARPGDVAVIDHLDLDRSHAEALVDAGVVAVVNAASTREER